MTSRQSRTVLCVIDSPQRGAVEAEARQAQGGEQAPQRQRDQGDARHALGDEVADAVPGGAQAAGRDIGVRDQAAEEGPAMIRALRFGRR